MSHDDDVFATAQKQWAEDIAKAAAQAAAMSAALKSGAVVPGSPGNKVIPLGSYGGGVTIGPSAPMYGPPIKPAQVTMEELLKGIQSRQVILALILKMLDDHPNLIDEYQEDFTKLMQVI